MSALALHVHPPRAAAGQQWLRWARRCVALLTVSLIAQSGLLGQRAEAQPQATEPQAALSTPASPDSRAGGASPLRCSARQEAAGKPPALCLRQLWTAPGQPLRLALLSGTGDEPKSATLTLGGQPLPDIAVPGSETAPLSVMLLVQLSEARVAPELVDSLRSVARATLERAGSTIGLLAYERGRQVLIEQPLTSDRGQVSAALSRLEKLSIHTDGPSFSFSDAIHSALNLLDQAPPASNSQTVLLAYTSGADDRPRSEFDRLVKSTLGRLSTRRAVLDVLFLPPGTGGAPGKLLWGLVSPSGGRLLSVGGREELPSRTREYLERVLGAVKLHDYALPDRLVAAGGPLELQPGGVGEEAIRLLLPATSPAAPVGLPSSASVTPSPPGEGGRATARGAVWWWLNGLLLALVLGALSVPGLRRRVRAALFAEPLPLVPTLRREISTGGGGLRSEPLPPIRTPTATRAPMVRKPVEWLDVFRGARGQTAIAWLLAPHSGRVHFLEKPDTLLGCDTGCDIYVSPTPGGASALGPAAPTLAGGSERRCRLVRDPGTGQLLVYPSDSLPVERNGQRLNSPTYVFDQDELAIGACRFRYFETRTSIPAGNN